MTEDEAKTKWCPFVRLKPTDSDGQAFNRLLSHASQPRDDYEIALAKCVGSACMAWRTTVVPIDSGDVVFNVQNKIVGYCGLAGEP